MTSPHSNLGATAKKRRSKRASPVVAAGLFLWPVRNWRRFGGPRTLTRALVVIAILLFVFTWRLDQAVSTAYSTRWFAPSEAGSPLACDSCLRLPTSWWVHAHWIATLIAFAFILLAAILWRARCVRETNSDVLGRSTFVASLVVLSCALLSALVRYSAGEGNWDNGSAIVVLNIIGIGVTIVIALAATNLRYQLTRSGQAASAPAAATAESPTPQTEPAAQPEQTADVPPSTGALGGLDGGGGGGGGGGGDSPSLAAAVARFVKRQRLNLLLVLALTILLTLVPDTSGQAIDSIRTWSPLPTGGDGAGPSGPARLLMGLATVLLLALALYESALRLAQAPAGTSEKARSTLLAALCLLGLVAGGLLWTLASFGPGLFLAGVILLIVLLLELPEQLQGPQITTATPDLARAEQRAPEWLAITPLLAFAATSVAASVDAALSGGTSWDTALIALPAVILGGFAILMTSEDLPPSMKPAKAGRWALVIGAFVAAGVILILAGSIDYAAWFAAFWLAVLVSYAVWLFRGDHGTPVAAGDLSPTPTASVRAFVTPLAVGAAAAVFFAAHLDPIGTGRTLGVLALANVALAAAVVFFLYLVRATLRYRPPRLLWWFGFQQLPVLSLVLIWWIAVGLVGSDTLHDIRVVERRHVTGADGKELIAPKPRLADAFASWAAAQPELAADQTGDPIPLVLVAAHGGGIRAAYWTASVLDCIVGISAAGTDPSKLKSADEAERARTCAGTRRTEPEQRLAAGRLFLVSGVSGGAVGLYAYLRQLLHNGQLGDGSWVDTRLAPDFASPAVAWALFHDLPNRLLGLKPDRGGCQRYVRAACWTSDRAAVLEDAFDSAWDVPATEALLRRAYDLRASQDEKARNNAALTPVLVTNATLTGGHTRGVSSAVDLGAWPGADKADRKPRNDPLPLAGTLELTDALCGRDDVRLSTAALLAARFPYVTPSGHVPGRCGESDADPPTDEPASLCAKRVAAACAGSFVDGGYVENSGLFTLIAVWPTLRAEIIKHNATHERAIAPLIIELDNHYQASISATVPAGGSRAESVIPIQTAFGGRNAMQTYARAAARRLLPDSCTITISPSLHPGLIAPLGWELSPSAREDLRAGRTEPHPAATERARTAQIERLRLLQERLAGESEQRAGMEPAITACLPR